MNTEVETQTDTAESATETMDELKAKIVELEASKKALEQEVADIQIELQAVMDEFERAYTEVVEARKEVERANNVKSTFLASMSHELRTPLNAIINFTKFLSKEKMGPVNEQQAATLSKVESSGIHLLNLINDVLDISKIEAGSMNLLVEADIDLKQLIQRMVNMSDGLLTDKEVDVVTKIADDLPAIIGDKQRIMQVLINLMSNACKYTEEGQITVDASSDDTNVIIKIIDTGVGIAEDEQASVFEAFKQTSAGLRKGSGTGLGMPISKRLAQAHGGDIVLESEVGVGSTFALILPIQSDVLEPNF